MGDTRLHSRRHAPICKTRINARPYGSETRRLIDREGHDVALTGGEFELLKALLERPNQVLTRDQLMNSMHGRDAGPFDRAIDVKIGRLRRKIEIDPSHPQLIKSVRGAGYVLTATVQPL